MARGINKAIIIGNLGADPEIRYTQNGGAVANINVATTESWKDKQTGERRENTEWHRVVMFGRLGEIAGEYLKKGSKVYIEGRLQTRKWQGQDGQDRYTTEIVANDMQMLDSRGGGDFGGGGGGYQGGPQGGGGGQFAGPGAAAGGAAAGGAPAGGGYGGAPADGGQPAPQGGGTPQGGNNRFDDMDDDIPF